MTPHAPLPVLILQPAPDDGPAYLATWLEQAGVVFELCQVGAHPSAPSTVPTSAEGYAALAVLGGSMSVNDPLPFLPRARQLVQDAVARGRPVLGHCLGGQLLAQALGARVVDNPVPEIGWSQVQATASAEARAWWGDVAHFPAFQWHFQTFGLPPGATLLAHNPACAHQAFAHGPHLGMQFHIEVDAAKLALWQEEAAEATRPLRGHASVQDPASMAAGTRQHLGTSQHMAARLYSRWVRMAGLA